jgi:hypothetical protein
MDMQQRLQGQIGGLEWRDGAWQMAHMQQRLDGKGTED